jgi:hypothetical protein
MYSGFLDPGKYILGSFQYQWQHTVILNAQRHGVARKFVLAILREVSDAALEIVVAVAPAILQEPLEVL